MKTSLSTTLVTKIKNVPHLIEAKYHTYLGSARYQVYIKPVKPPKQNDENALNQELDLAIDRHYLQRRLEAELNVTLEYGVEGVAYLLEHEVLGVCTVFVPKDSEFAIRDYRYIRNRVVKNYWRCKGVEQGIVSKVYMLNLTLSTDITIPSGNKYVHIRKVEGSEIDSDAYYAKTSDGKIKEDTKYYSIPIYPEMKGGKLNFVVADINRMNDLNHAMKKLGERMNEASIIQSNEYACIRVPDKTTSVIFKDKLDSDWSMNFHRHDGLERKELKIYPDISRIEKGLSKDTYNAIDNLIDTLQYHDAAPCDVHLIYQHTTNTEDDEVSPMTTKPLFVIVPHEHMFNIEKYKIIDNHGSYRIGLDDISWTAQGSRVSAATLVYEKYTRDEETITLNHCDDSMRPDIVLKKESLSIIDGNTMIRYSGDYFVPSPYYIDIKYKPYDDSAKIEAEVVERKHDYVSWMNGAHNAFRTYLKCCRWNDQYGINNFPDVRYELSGYLHRFVR